MAVLLRPAQNPAGSFLVPPIGWAFHGSRSGQPNSTEQEFIGTSNYGMTTLYAFNWTVGDLKLAKHLEASQWGHHAFRASSLYLSIEFAQSGYQHRYQDISDEQVWAAAVAIKKDRAFWRNHPITRLRATIPLRFRTHAELEHDGETVLTSGKTDVFRYGDPRADDLKQRVLACLRELGEK